MVTIIAPKAGIRNVGMKWTTLWAGMLMVILGMSGSAWALSPEELVGTWKLVSTVRQVTGKAEIVANLGAHPNGVLVITPEHRFVVIETADGREPEKTTEEFAALQRSELAYSGIATFSPNPDDPRGLKMVNAVDISWNEAWTGTNQVRFLSLDGNRLTIRTGPGKNPNTGETGTTTLVWERSK